MSPVELIRCRPPVPATTMHLLTLRALPCQPSHPLPGLLGPLPKPESYLRSHNWKRGKPRQALKGDTPPHPPPTFPWRLLRGLRTQSGNSDHTAARPSPALHCGPCQEEGAAESAVLFNVASCRLSSCGQGHRKEPGFTSRVQAPCSAEVSKAVRSTQHGVLF